MSSHKSYFLWVEHARMAELEHRVESACRESQVRVAEAAAARAEGQRAVEQATAAEQGLKAAKVHHEETEVGLRASLANTEAALQEALVALEPEQAALESAQKALEAEQRARSEADQEVLALRGRVMGTEDASAWLREQVARQAEDLSTLEASRIGVYLFCFLVVLIFPSACF